MYINSISKLLRIGGQHNPTMVNPSLADLDCDSDLEDETSGNLNTNRLVGSILGCVIGNLKVNNFKDNKSTRNKFLPYFTLMLINT